jgi:hypothetical protein
LFILENVLMAVASNSRSKGLKLYRISIVLVGVLRGTMPKLKQASLLSFSRSILFDVGVGPRLNETTVPINVCV